MPLAFSPKVMNGMLNLMGGPSLPSQYIACVMPPSGMFSFAPATISYPLRVAAGVPLAVMVEKASIPGFQFLTKEIYRHGKHMKLPYGRGHDTLKLTFICTNSMIERTFFDLWATYIQPQKSHYMEYFDNFKSTIWISKRMGSGLVDTILADPTAIGTGAQAALNSPLAEIGSIFSTYEIQEAYPVRVAAQELSASETHSYLSLDVEFEYTHCISIVDRLIPDEMKGPNDTIQVNRLQFEGGKPIDATYGNVLPVPPIL